MPKGTTTRQDILNYVFNKTAISWAGNTSFFVALHTADPTADGSQDSSEIVYEGYARQEVVRTSSGWTVANTDSVVTSQNTAEIEFPIFNETTSQNIAYVSVGTSETGAGQLLYYNAVTGGPFEITEGQTPRITADNLTITEE